MYWFYDNHVCILLYFYCIFYFLFNFIIIQCLPFVSNKDVNLLLISMVSAADAML